MRRLYRDERGSISFFLVFATVALVALLGMIVNTGTQTSRKVRMQGTADAVTVSSATWVARGLNVHSAINVFQTQLVGGAINMHSLHDAMKYTHPIACNVAQVCCNCVGGPQCIVCCPCCVLYVATWAAMLVVEFPLGEYQMYGTPCTRQESLLNLCKHLAEDGGMFWRISGALEPVNRAVQPAFTALATFQSQEIARANGADFGWVATLRAQDPTDLPESLKGLVAWVPSKQGTKEDFCQALKSGAPGYEKLHGYDAGDGPWKAGAWRSGALSATGLLVGTPALFAAFTIVGYDRLCTAGREDAVAENVPIRGRVGEGMPGIPVDPQTVAGCQQEQGFSKWSKGRYRWHSDPRTYTNEQGQTHVDVHESATDRAPDVQGGAAADVFIPTGTPDRDNPARATVTHSPDPEYTTLSSSDLRKSCGYDPTSEEAGLRRISTSPLTYQRNEPVQEIEVQPHVPAVPCPEHCSDGEDDDFDELVDCDDPDCAAACNTPDAETSCSNGADDDDDGFADCRDEDCRNDGTCTTAAENCWNGVDDDGDLSVDCSDMQCGGRSGCPGASGENCWNGEDDDGDGAADCADSSCAGVPDCGTCTPQDEIERVVRYRYEVTTWSFQGYWTDNTDLGEADGEPVGNQSGQTKIPLPMMLDMDDPDFRGSLQFVGMATTGGTNPWGQRLFGSGTGQITFAQAEVYNEIGEDLWTQDWRVRLVPADVSSPSVAAALTLMSGMQGGPGEGAVFLGVAAVDELGQELGAGSALDQLSHH